MPGNCTADTFLVTIYRYQVQGGIDYAIAKSLAAAPFADLLWMETKTASDFSWD